VPPLDESLQLASLEDLLEELGTRCEAWVYASCGAMGETTQATMRWSGQIFTVLGLAEHLRMHVQCGVAQQVDDEGEEG
jgi:hypothetical protein